MATEDVRDGRVVHLLVYARGHRLLPLVQAGCQPWADARTPG
ncbi:hypothetical protein [Streptomyces sp. bgisy091]